MGGTYESGNGKERIERVADFFRVEYNNRHESKQTGKDYRTDLSV